MANYLQLRENRTCDHLFTLLQSDGQCGLAWTGCSCGTGEQRRTRTCQNPKASILNDMCNGDSVEYRPCSNNTCTKPDNCVVEVMKVFVCNPIFRGICNVCIMSSNSSYANLIRVAPPVSSHEYSNASKFNPKSVDFRCIF